MRADRPTRPGDCMIRCLHVRNLAIIKEATLDLGPGLNVLTGETGAGKSILVDALMLGLGARAETDRVRTGSDRGSVEIEFDLAAHPAALAFLGGKGYPVEGGAVVVHRELAAGRSRGFIGGVLAPAADLRVLGTLCVAVHGQHQHQALLDPAGHVRFLDRRAALGDRLDAMADAFNELTAASTRLDAMRDGAQRLAQHIDSLRWQAQEIDAARVGPHEITSLRSERELLRHAETVLGHSRAAVEALYDGEGSAVARLAEGLRAARAVVPFDPGLADDLGRAESARAEVEELAFRLRDLAARLHPDPQRLEAVDERLHLVEALLRKCVPGGDEAALAEYREAIGDELRQLTGGGESVADLEATVARLRERAAACASELSRARRTAAARLEREVESELALLAMPGTRFAVDVRTRPAPGSGLWIDGEEVAVDATGCDVVEFLLSANRGEALRPLASVASGGELSRVMLALEVALLGGDAPRSLIFDEVDAGIGGAVAEVLGRKLKALAAGHQVICVTHLAPIASQADRHVRVSKRVVRGRTEVGLETLDGAGRVRELARMMTGETITPSALRHAAEMLTRGGSGRD